MVLSAWLLLHVYVLVDVLDFVIVLFRIGVFEYMLFCVLMVVATRVCFGSRSRLRYRVVSEWCFHYWFTVVGGGGGVVYICKTCLCTPRKLLRGDKTKLRGTFGNFNVPPRGFCQVWLNTHLSLKINMQ